MFWRRLQRKFTFPHYPVVEEALATMDIHKVRHFSVGIPNLSSKKLPWIQYKKGSYLPTII